MNNIAEQQLKESQLERLAAQRHYYSSSKRLLAWGMILTVPVVLILSLLVAWNQDLDVWAALWGLGIAIIQLVVIFPSVDRRREIAAKIQELFDTDVLQLKWNKLVCGTKPHSELIIDAAEKYRKHEQDYSSLRNWYPPAVEVLPLPLARLVCQRTNCWWDSRLRRRYTRILLAVLTIVVLVVFFLGLINGMTLEKFILVVMAPLLPVFILIVKEYRDNHKSACRLDRLREYVEEIWGKAIRNEFSENAINLISRELQNEIYLNRLTNPLIFNWIYNSLRKSQEEQMNKAAESLVQEASQNG